MKALASKAAARASLCLFLAALMLAVFAAGMYVRSYEMFPSALLKDAHKTWKQLIRHHSFDRSLRIVRFVDITPNRAETRRFEFIGAAGFSGPILAAGVAGNFADLCPDFAGCLAVEYGAEGELLHAWPYRPEEFDNKEPMVRFRHETLPWLSFDDKVTVVRASRYPNGDLLAVFEFMNTFPYAGGVARIDRAGRPVWYREDFSHHAPYLTADGVALVPGMRIRQGPIGVSRHRDARLRVACRTSILADVVRVIAGDGRLLEEISVLDALLESPYAPILTWSSCDPTHLNYVHQVREDAAGADGIAPGDLVISLKNLHAFGILDRASRRLKKLVRGGFFHQHAVTHLEGSRFLMFDNWGRDAEHDPSRLLMVDLADGTETTIFPNDETPDHLRRAVFSSVKGHLSVSPDRRRAIVTSSEEGAAIEVRLADGAVLAVLNPLHDLSHLERFPEERKTRAGRYNLTTVNYIGDAHGG